jgi:hypothetical protein
MRFIPTAIHGVLDYLTAAVLILLPRILGFSDNSTAIMTFMGVALIIYSLVTRYELGVIKMLPMRGHLGLDFVSGILMLAAPFFFQIANSSEMIAFMAIGLMEVLVSLVTKTHPGYGYEESRLTSDTTATEADHYMNR